LIAITSKEETKITLQTKSKSELAIGSFEKL
jgi:hypothetical protein